MKLGGFREEPRDDRKSPSSSSSVRPSMSMVDA